MTDLECPYLTVDIVIEKEGGIVLVERKNDPYEGSWAIPGGFVERGETVEEAACREAMEETGLEVNLKGLVGVYSEPGRDPRGHTVSICYSADVEGGYLRASTDAEDVKVFKDVPWNKLAFDHDKILRDFKAGDE